MHNLFGLFIALFAAAWLFAAARGMVKEFKAAGRAKWITFIMYLLILIGGGGFFAAGLSATGIIKLPTSYEWPAGYVRGVVTAVDGNHIVPLVPSGRLQIYDSQWHFIRGWNVDASGGDFKAQCSSDGVIEIFTARGGRHYSFTEDGHLISSETFAEPFSSLPIESQSVVVPTSPLLWIFSSPFLSWAVVAAGLLGFAVTKMAEQRAGVGS
jgi:hypothetical protein